MEEPHDMISIPDFYSDRCVFITGATGFLGKVLMEKLLRSCPRVKCLYVLMRPKRGMCIKDRLEKLLDEPIFNRLRDEQPNFKTKVSALHGDIMEPGLGISETDLATLISQVSIVFHSAATVKFDEPIRFAVQMNVTGVRKVLQLCRKIKNLEALVHVSTAYSNCDKDYIEEKIYPSPLRPKQLIDALEWMDDEILGLITPKLMGGKPNTYTYTKQLAETLIQEEGQDLPVAIIRPSIVGAAWKEPLPGWIDNLTGPSGLCVAIGKGVMRILKAKKEDMADLVPVDLPVNMMIAIAWYTGLTKPENMLLYHITTGITHHVSWREMVKEVLDHFKRIPYDACFRCPNVVIMPNGYLSEWYSFVSQTIPAYVVDLGYKVMGQKPRMVKIHHRIEKAMDAVSFFTHNTWNWSRSNLDMLKSRLSQEDGEEFYMDPSMLDWPSYIQTYCLGTKLFVLKEDMSALPLARAHLFKLRILRYTFNAIMVVIFWRVLVAKSRIARKLWRFIMSLTFKYLCFFRSFRN